VVKATLDACFAPDLRDRLIGDKPYDSDALDAGLAAERGIEMIVPRRQITQDRRPLRRCRRRWGGGRPARIARGETQSHV